MNMDIQMYILVTLFYNLNSECLLFFNKQHGRFEKKGIPSTPKVMFLLKGTAFNLK